MKLGEIDLDELIRAFDYERNAWIKVAQDERRRQTEAERITGCVLHALAGALRRLPRRDLGMVP